MCIIVYKPAGVDVPTKETLCKCYDNNSDGAGFMYPSNGNVVINRGYFNFEEMYKDIECVSSAKDVSMVFHFRIATMGGVNLANCHPFPLTTEVKEFTDKTVISKAGVAHNGIFSGLGNKTMSDTAEFITTMLAPCESFVGHEGFDALVTYAIGSSKLIILYGDGNIKSYGKWIEDEGVYYSNSTYLHSFKSISNWNGVGNSRLYSYEGYYDDEEHDVRHSHKNNKLFNENVLTCSRCGQECTDNVEIMYGFCFDCLTAFGYDPSQDQEYTECSYCTNLVFFDKKDSKDIPRDEDGYMMCVDCQYEQTNGEAVCRICGALLSDSFENKQGICYECMETEYSVCG